MIVYDTVHTLLLFSLQYCDSLLCTLLNATHCTVPVQLDVHTIPTTTMTSSAASMITKRPVALVMGVANHRSIAWACVEAFQRHFRPARVDGVADISTIETLHLLLKTL